VSDYGIRRPSAAGRTDTSPVRRKKGTAPKVIRHELRLSGSTHRERVAALSAAFRALSPDKVHLRALMDIHSIVSRYREEHEQ